MKKLIILILSTLFLLGCANNGVYGGFGINSNGGVGINIGTGIGF